MIKLLYLLLNYYFFKFKVLRDVSKLENILQYSWRLLKGEKM